MRKTPIESLKKELVELRLIPFSVAAKRHTQPTVYSRCHIFILMLNGRPNQTIALSSSRSYSRRKFLRSRRFGHFLWLDFHLWCSIVTICLKRTVVYQMHPTDGLQHCCNPSVGCCRCRWHNNCCIAVLRTF